MDQNQRRRRPVRRRDGTFNYSPDVYCTKYDETTGICEDGDDCPYLHRTSGDTERRYHLRYYKTGICVYDTDSRGFCVKNGQHCAFAHGIHDLRSPVYDIRELQAMEGGVAGVGGNGSEGNGVSGNGSGVSGVGAGGDGAHLNSPNNLDKERNALNEDPRWNDSAYVLANYKTELCKRPPRLCRQGYACPHYHNAKDKRRSPKKVKYRSTPCPNVKAGDEWGDPANCDAGDSCAYCHTRTEQQFHPEIYKSTKCNDVLQTAYCPRGPFCAFAHGDKEMQTRHELMNEEIVELKNFVPPLNNGNSNNGNNGNNSGLHASSTATSITGSRSQSKNAFVASSLPDHFPIHGGVSGFNNLLNMGHPKTGMSPSESNTFSQNLSSAAVAASNPGAMSVGERSFGFPLGPIGSRPRSYSTSQAQHTSVTSGFDMLEQMLGRTSLNTSQPGEPISLVNGDMRSSPSLSNRRPSGMFDNSPNPLFARGFSAGGNDVGLSAAASRARSAIADNYNEEKVCPNCGSCLPNASQQRNNMNPYSQQPSSNLYNTADTVGSVVESAIGEIDLSLDDISEMLSLSIDRCDEQPRN